MELLELTKKQNPPQPNNPDDLQQNILPSNDYTLIKQTLSSRATPTENDPLRTNAKPKLLALHGASSNNSVTKQQLQNLGITEDSYEIVYLRGILQVKEGDPALSDLFHGPWYSWIDGSSDEDITNSLTHAVKEVLVTVATHGPFDGIYGFSSGGAIAALASNICKDQELLDMVLMDSSSSTAENDTGGVGNTMKRGSVMMKRPSVVGNMMKRGSVTMKRGSVTMKRPTQMKRPSVMLKRTSISNLNLNLRKQYVEEEGSPTMDLESGGASYPPFKFVVVACGAAPREITSMREAAGLGPLKRNAADTPSFHLIGLEDDFKAQSESIVELFDLERRVIYLTGKHEIRKTEKAGLGQMLKEAMEKRAVGATHDSMLPIEWKPVSDASSIAVLPNVQVAMVKLDRGKLPEAREKGATICSMLAAQPENTPFLRVARQGNISTTYGELLRFIQPGGDGDLRALGVKPGEVVAYGAPIGGSASSAIAFMSIGAQTAAAPLSQSTSEPEALDALDQFDAKHLILFDSVDAPGLEAAFKIFASKGRAKLHRAAFVGDNKPGMFKYKTDETVELSEPLDLSRYPPLVNPEDGVCLLLRTSGTTARPKGVPLKQGQLITNGAILGESMKLRADDVCYSVMPLFHIGGISASVLCSLAVGASVTCDGELYNPERMIDALAKSVPQPTWYSAVPTIHNSTATLLREEPAKFKSYGVGANGVWKTGHSLRMIRSGAAALLPSDGDHLSRVYGNLPIFPTYSMSEQMPISQPPAGMGDLLTRKPGSVGVPVAASCAIVSRGTLQPQPPGVEGEVAISGATVLDGYLNNPAADRSAFFYLTLPERKQLKDAEGGSEGRFFLTGDVGVLDSEGFLTLKGRAKELIKKGGEQVSPFEVEEPLQLHPWVRTALCFSVPSKLYGEEVGCAIVLSPKAPEGVELRDAIVELRKLLKKEKLSPTKFPTKWKICEDSELPKTKTKKYIRVGLSTVLGLDPVDDDSTGKPAPKAKLDWDVLSGLRFCLSCYVMFMHIGSNESWGRVANLRQFPWHVHAFFTLGGFSMAAPMAPPIKKKLSYFVSRMGSMHPMYCVALLFALGNLLVVCRPSTFRSTYHWDSQRDDMYVLDSNGDQTEELAPLFCEGTPALVDSYWGSLVLTLIIHFFGLQATPLWSLSWFMGFYLWFSSMYYQCIALFPTLYNSLYRKRKEKFVLLVVLVALLSLNFGTLATAWFLAKDAEGYNHYNNLGETIKDRAEPGDLKDAEFHNGAVLSFYLFGPLWVLYFVIGATTAFLYDAFRPAEQHQVLMWGAIADLITLIIIAVSVGHIYMGSSYHDYDGNYVMRPDEGDHFTDNAQVNRLWDNLYGRGFAPLTTLWIFCLSTGKGVTAKMLSTPFLVKNLSPSSYNCFLFHQIIGQWYYFATRGIFWNWWRFRKTQTWFSPEPCPVEWYEYPYVVMLVVAWSIFMTQLEPHLLSLFNYLRSRARGEIGPSGGPVVEKTTTEVLLKVIEDMTGIEPKQEWGLEDCGLASIGVPVLVGLLNKAYSTPGRHVTITVPKLVEAKTIKDVVGIVDLAKEAAEHHGV